MVSRKNKDNLNSLEGPTRSRESSPGCFQRRRESRCPHTLPSTTAATASEEQNIRAGQCDLSGLKGVRSAAKRASSQAGDRNSSLLNATMLEIRRKIRQKLDREDKIRHQRLLEEEEERARQLREEQYEIVSLVGVRSMQESVGRIPVPAQSMLRPIIDDADLTSKSSLTLVGLMGPLPIPPDFSMAARRQLEEKLLGVNARMAFCAFGDLVDRIKGRATPRPEDVRVFFRFANVLQFHMYLRHQPKQCRYSVHCYVLQDRRDFIAHVPIPCLLFRELVDRFPHTLPNIHHLEDIFQLTPVPPPLSFCLRAISSLIHLRSLYDRLGELTYEFFQPQETLLSLTRQ